MDIRAAERRSITAAKAIEILKQKGTQVSLEEAEIILDFMYKMSKLTVDNFIKAKLKRSV